MFVKRFIIAALAVQAVPAWALDDASVTRDGTTLTVRWTSSKPVDVILVDHADAPAKTGTLVSRADSDGSYFMTNAGTTRRYFILREAGKKRTLRTAERLVPLATGSNFRDIGGYRTASGKYVRWGMIYRSGATPVLSADDVAQVKALGLRDIFDLRSSEERIIAPTRLTGIRYTAIDYSMMSMVGDRRAMSNGIELYRNFPVFLAPQLKIVFDDLIRKQVPMVYHCSAGQDRTGFTSAMILSALGVPRATITADYHLSTAYRQPENELPPISEELAKANPVAGMFASYQKSGAYSQAQPLKEADGRAFLDGAFAEIDARWGSVDAYLEQQVGLTKGDLAMLRATYLE